MKNEWLQFTGWSTILCPDTLPIWLILVFLYTVLTVKVVLGIFKIPKETYSLFKVSLCVYLISFCVFILECALTHIFVTLRHFNDPSYGFIAARDSFGLSIYENISFFIFTFISVCICIYLTYRLNIQFTVKYLTDSGSNKYHAILLISILTSPLIFFISLEKLLEILIPINW